MNWRPMRTAPKGEVILITECAGGEHYNVLQAFWGRPPGFKDKDAAWWGITFVECPEAMFDVPELRARLVAITPLCWKPVISARRRK